MLEALEDLKSDIARNCSAVALQHLPLEVANYFREVDWPWKQALLEAIDEELEEQGAVLEQLVENSEDAIHPETAAAIGAAFQVGALLIHDLMMALPKTHPQYAAFQERVGEFAARSTHVMGLVEEATIDLPDPDPDDPSEPGDDEDDEDDSDEDGGA